MHFKMSGQGTFRKSKYSTQIYSTIIINILSFSHGIAFGWISPVISLLQSSDTPLNKPITTNEVSWIGGYWSIGCISGSIIFGLLIDKIGRKRTITLIALPHIGLWITSIFATETHHFYVSRFLGGLAGGGITVTFPIFVAEISSNNIRGRLGSVYMVSMNFGIMVGYILSSYFNYNTVGVLVVGFPVLSCILSYILLSETPQFLLKTNREENALKSIKFYRNHKKLRGLEDYKSVYDEFEIIRFSVVEQRRSGSITLADFTTKQSLKALFVGAGLMALNQLSGGYTFLNYAATFFEKSYSDIDANLSTIIVGISQIVGTLSSLILVDFLGRKMLLIMSFSGMSAGMFCCGIYQYFYPIYDLSRFTWIPTVTFSGVIFFGSIGVFSAVFVVFVELLPTKIRAVGSIICVSVLSSLGFIMLRIVPKLLDSLDLQGVLYLFSGCSLGGMIFVLIFVQETKGKVLDAVEDVHEKESKITLFNK